jgi:predicted nucleic acid-binding protein
MSGKEILVDTNIILHLLNGSDTLQEILQGKDIYISFITELELVGFKNITAKEEHQIIELLNDCSIISLNNRIKEKYVELRKKYHLKLADAIIAATALSFDFPLITSDKQFKTVKELNLITYQHTAPLADPKKDA